MSGHDIHDQTFWDNFAGASYETVAHRFTTLFAERALDMVASEMADIPPPARVLDIATGTGALAIAAARRGFDVLATDFSAGMVDKVLAYALANLDARQMDGQMLDLPDASFDAAFSMFGIMLFPDWRAGLAEMVRVLRPGGVGVLGTWPQKDGAATNLILAEVCGRLFPAIEAPPMLPGVAAWREPARFRAALEAAGFADVRIESVTYDFLFDAPQLDDPDRWFGFSPWWGLLDAAQRETALAEIREIMPSDGSPLPVPSTALIAVGQKSRSR